jgi:hypothetical protein
MWPSFAVQGVGAGHETGHQDSAVDVGSFCPIIRNQNLSPACCHCVAGRATTRSRIGQDGPGTKIGNNPQPTPAACSASSPLPSCTAAGRFRNVMDHYEGTSVLSPLSRACRDRHCTNIAFPHRVAGCCQILLLSIGRIGAGCEQAGVVLVWSWCGLGVVLDRVGCTKVAEGCMSVQQRAIFVQYSCRFITLAACRLPIMALARHERVGSNLPDPARASPGYG